jgi:chromosome segregation ATPase
VFDIEQTIIGHYRNHAEERSRQDTLIRKLQEENEVLRSEYSQRSEHEVEDSRSISDIKFLYEQEIEKNKKVTKRVSGLQEKVSNLQEMIDDLKDEKEQLENELSKFEAEEVSQTFGKRSESISPCLNCEENLKKLKRSQSKMERLNVELDVKNDEIERLEDKCQSL